MAEDKEGNALKDAILEIPKLVKQFKDKHFGSQKFAEIKVGDKTFSYSGAEVFGVGVDVKDCADGDYETDTHKFTVKSGKVIDYKPKETPAPAADFSAQIKTVTDAYEAKLAAQKTDFDAQVKELGERFTKKISDLINGQLKDMFDLIDTIAKAPQVDSQFKKKDGEPTPAGEDRWTRIEREAKQLSQKVFKN